MKKKRLISKLLSLVTVLAMLAAMSGTAAAFVFVPSYPLWVGGTQVDADNATDSSGNQHWSYDASTNTLTLNGVDIQTSYNDSGIYYQGTEVLTINLAPDSTNKIGVDASLNCAIRYVPEQPEQAQLQSVTEESSAGLVITGSGSLEAKASFGIHNVKTNITISGGKVSVKGSTVGLFTDYGTIEITDGEVEVEGGFDGINGGKGVKITGGTVKATGGEGAGINGKCVIGSEVTSVTASGAALAIKGKVENAVAGTGWKNMEGTEGEVAIPTSSEGQIISETIKKVQFPAAKVDVKKADPTANAPTGLTATVGQTLADVKLTNPEGNTEGTWAWADSSTKLEKAGEQSFKANFTPKDTDTYNSVENVDVEVTVKEQEKEPEKQPEKQPEQEPEKQPETVPAPAKEEKITCTTNFRGLKLRVAKRDKSSIKVKWTEKKDADGYKVYGGLCTGKDDEMELLKTIKNNKTTSWTHKKLKEGTSYKYKVVAYKKVKGEKKSLYKSMAVHVYTKGGKYTVAKGVKVNKSEVKLKKGKTFQIEASEVKDEKKKDLNTHRDICYESSNEKVATVSEKGKIKTVKKGSATVYAYSETGAFKKVKVIVK